MSASLAAPLSASPVDPVAVSNVQPWSPMYHDTIDTGITRSSFFSLRKISVRCAHGQASET